MTNHASNVEIEDVLSSIRRLVSEDGRSRLRPDDRSDDESGTLVLTPQQRVRENEEQNSEAETTESGPMLLSQPLGNAGDVPSGDGPLDLQSLVEREVAAALVSGDASLDGSAAREEVVSPWSEEDEATEGKVVDLREVEAGAPPLEIAGGMDVGDAAQESLTGTGEAPDKADEISGPEGHQADDAPPRDVSGEPEPRTPAEAARAAQEAAHALFAAERAGLGKSAQSLEDKISELEAMIDQADDTWDTAAESSAHHDPRELPEPRGRAQSSAPLPMDEDALRDIVADIVRQELQGALGERLTRNVRKLVRREIQRAIAGVDAE